MSSNVGDNKAMRPAAELLKRDAIMRTLKAGGSGSTPGVAEGASSAAAVGALVTDAQQYVMFNIAHVRNFIRSPDGAAWLRILGFFPTLTALQRHANRILAYDPKLDIRRWPTGKFFAIMRDKRADKWETIGDRVVQTFVDEEMRAREAAHVETIVTAHLETRAKHMEETRQNAMRRRMGDAELTATEKLGEDDDEEEKQASAKASAEAARLEDEADAAMMRLGIDPAAASLVKARAPASVAAATEATIETFTETATGTAEPKTWTDEDGKVEEEDDFAPTLAPVATPAPAAQPVRVLRGPRSLREATGAVAADVDLVLPIPQTLEVRFQRYTPIVVVDDSVTLAQHEAMVDAWCDKRDAAYKELREALLWQALEEQGRLRKSTAEGKPLTFAEVDAIRSDVRDAAVLEAKAFAKAAARQEALLELGMGEADISPLEDDTLDAEHERARLAVRTAGNRAEADACERGHVACTAAEAQAAGLTTAAVLPPFHRLIRNWFNRHPPPRGHNVWGEYIGDTAAAGKGWIRLRRAEVLAHRVEFARSQGRAVTLDEADAELVAPASTTRELAAWTRMRDMRIEERTWHWAGHDHQPLRPEVLRDWYKANAKPDLTELREEVAVAAYPSCETELEVQAWCKMVQNVDEVRHHSLSCIANYEWVLLEMRHNDSILRTYRNEHVHDIMGAQQAQAARAKELDMEARMGKRKKRVLEVGANAVQIKAELPQGLSKEVWREATASAQRADAEAEAELAAARAAEAEGRTYTHTKLQAHTLKMEDTTTAGMADEADVAARAKEREAAIHDTEAGPAGAGGVGGAVDEEEAPKSKRKPKSSTSGGASTTGPDLMDIDLSKFKPRKAK